MLSLAANQYGPRLIRNFMASPNTQLVLGVFVMTILYCLIILAAIGFAGNEGTFPFSTVTIAIVLMAINVGLLVLFIHTLARSIVSETVIERVGSELDEVGSQLPLLGEDPQDEPAEALPPCFEKDAVFFGARESGYVLAIEFDCIVKLAEAKDLLVTFDFRPGDYVVEGGRGIGVLPAARLTEDLATEINHALVIAVHRTPVQDPEFSIRHLVEIAVRAPSPGINDPYTAVAVIRLAITFDEAFAAHRRVSRRKRSCTCHLPAARIRLFNRRRLQSDSTKRRFDAARRHPPATSDLDDCGSCTIPRST